MTTAYFRGVSECCRPRSGRTSTSGTTIPRKLVTPVRTVGMPGTGVTESTGKTSRMLWRSMANRLLERVIRQTREGKPACGARSEERRVGKECRYGWAREHEKR